MTHVRRLGFSPLLVACLLAVGQLLPAQAQQSAPAPASAPPPDQLEPGVNTTPAAAAPAASAVATPPAPAVTPRQAPATAAAPSAAPAAGTSGSSKANARKGPDRLQLDATDITGSRELPKVLYIVPWKHSDLGDPIGRPVNSLLDEVLQPLDRDVFQRENRYYDALKPDQTAPKEGAVPGSATKP
jgi:hypothetical protein